MRDEPLNPDEMDEQRKARDELRGRPLAADEEHALRLLATIEAAEATLDDEQAAHADTLRLLADREALVADLAGQVRAGCEVCFARRDRAEWCGIHRDSLTRADAVTGARRE